MALVAWRDYLTDLEGPTLLGASTNQETSAVVDSWQRKLSVDLSGQLQSLAREHGLTLNTIIQGLWAVLLGRLTDRDDVVFGITVSGRPPDLDGVEQMVGLFINTVPLRVRLAPGEPLAAMLARIQESQARLCRAPIREAYGDQAASGRRRALRHADGIRELSVRQCCANRDGRRSANCRYPDTGFGALSIVFDHGSRESKSISGWTMTWLVLSEQRPRRSELA